MKDVGRHSERIGANQSTPVSGRYLGLLICGPNCITGELSHDAIASRMLDFLTEETWLVMLDPNKNTTYSNLAPTEVASLERALREFQSIQRELRE